ncbi:MAG: TolC family outer membrane protein [Hahellaceae bacterium]|nr:TolC family outer membrane protein [Hahellaceae bacterium]MCP5168653.1 TolC family outer membrane protein [Hahellaceae bacterium]
MHFLPKALCLSMVAATSICAHAVDLVTAYEQALNYDSSLAASQSAYLAEQETVTQARAALLPQINLSAQTGYKDSTYAPDDGYTATSYGLSLTQPLFRAQNWFGFEASKYLSQSAEAEFAKAQQTLILDTATAYFSILRAKENLATTNAAEAAFKRQWEQAKERFDVGLIAITEVHEARASYDAATTSRIQAEGALNIAYEGLARLTGQVYEQLNALNAEFPINPPTPMVVEDWVNTAFAQNWSIKSAEFGVKAAEENVSQQKTGHYPTLDLTASYSHTSLDNKNPVDLSGEDSSIALVFNMPLYQGGGTEASYRKSKYQLDQARYSLESVKRTVQLNTRSLFTKLKTDIDTVASQKQNIVSRESALEATRAGYSVGTRNIVEVLDAERAYYVALRDYANARIDYVIDTLQIKQAAGTLSPEDLASLNRWLTASQ